MLGITEEHRSLTETVDRLAADQDAVEVARRVVDGDAAAAEPFDKAVAAHGLLGLHLPEAQGGSGYGRLELAIVLERLGRALAPGATTASVVTSAVLASSTTARGELAGLADGSARGATTWSTSGLTVRRDGDVVVLTGRSAPVLGAPEADVLVLGADDTWVVVRSDEITVEPRTGLDASRSLGVVVLDDVELSSDRVLDGVDDAVVRDTVRSLVAAELAGLASWCLDTAVEYAKVREQFGKPIGQFQAIKHLCSDMLVRVEQARACAWDAARVTDASDRALTAAVAIQLATSAAVEVAKDCIQVLGGIGYTWEHDAHLYLRRATALRALVVADTHPASEVAALALEGRRRTLGLDLDGEEATAVRTEVRDLVASLEGLDDRERRVALADAGWLVPHWPEPWGRGAGAVAQLVADVEFADAGVERPDLVIGNWAMATIVQHGTDEQRERFVRPTLHGDITWCQMFSEPGAGSDLASLTTRAERVEGGWELTGQKVWTSLAHESDWSICLARTDPDAAKHDGITYFLVDMDSDGLDVRPLVELTGRRAFNEVFLDGVFVPDDCVVGEVDGGWGLARTTLSNERVAMSTGSSMGPGVEGVLRAANGVDDGLPPQTMEAIGELVCEGQSLALLGLRTTLAQLSGTAPGAAASVRKLVGMHHAQDCSELTLGLFGANGATTDGPVGAVADAFLRTRALSIAGGTTEVQKSIVGERLLGLPRDR